MLFFQRPLSQYHINRVNPFKQLLETLEIFSTEGCDGSVLSLKCPKGTKVIKICHEHIITNNNTLLDIHSISMQLGLPEAYIFQKKTWTDNDVDLLNQTVLFDSNIPLDLLSHGPYIFWTLFFLVLLFPWFKVNHI